mmetsp:Transcript_263/g.646  ORF Transcript_263/g.646 Transcript_263/m.646 type:complete len:209 (+) Transcript_263:55-681(+)
MQVWRERLQASIAQSRKVYGGNFVQLATAGGDGRPHVRTVVFRGFAEDERAIRVISHSQAAKIAQARENPAAEVVWWFAKSSEQYRLSGRLQVVDSAESDGRLRDLRVSQWKDLSDPAREQFFWPTPGKVVPEGCTDFKDLAPEPLPPGGREPENEAGKRPILAPPDTFVLLLFWPETVHYLKLGTNFAQLDQWDDEHKRWTCKHVVP